MSTYGHVVHAQIPVSLCVSRKRRGKNPEDSLGLLANEATFKPLTLNELTTSMD